MDSYPIDCRLRRRKFAHEPPYCKSATVEICLEGLDSHHCAPISYKQNKFNLLREQSEGYSKLTTELTSNLGPARSPVEGAPVEPQGALDARAGLAWERVVGLIGYFDLDPNRALDIILDVFSVHLPTHHTFFLSFLSHSPWSSPNYRGRTTTTNASSDAMSEEPTSRQYQDKDLDEVLCIAETLSGYSASPQQTRTTAGGRVLAQVLGFKFSYYQVGLVLVAVICLD